jgi:hypothetical protein
MKTFLLGTTLVVFALTAALAGQSNSQQLKGHLVDTVCAKGQRVTSASPATPRITRACAA